MLKKRSLGFYHYYLLFFVFLSSSLLSAQIPEYYNTINLNDEGEFLREHLHDLVSSTQHTVLPYTSSQEVDVWDALRMMDQDLEQEEPYLLLIYGYDDNDNNPRTDRTRYHIFSCHENPCPEGTWNREHVYPRSLGTPNLGFDNAGSDVHALRAIDTDMNTLRSNRLFDAGQGHAQLTARGLYYPGDEWKGDVARMMMFMYLRYPTQCIATNVGYGPTTYAPLNDMPDIFLEWNAEDPVSDFERARNEIAYDLQGNRNPFIDNPALATKIWSGPQSEDTWGILEIQDYEEEIYVFSPTITSDETCLSYTLNTTLDYAVYDITGKQIGQNKLERCIDFSSYESGVYFVMLQNIHTKQAIRIVVP